MWSSPRLQGRSSKLDTNRVTLKSVFKREVCGNSILADAFRGPQPLRHSVGPPHAPEAPCEASSVRAADELAPSWLLSESAIFSCRRASAAPRLPRPEPRRLRGQTEMVSECDTTSNTKRAVTSQRLVPGAGTGARGLLACAPPIAGELCWRRLAALLSGFPQT